MAATAAACEMPDTGTIREGAGAALIFGNSLTPVHKSVVVGIGIFSTHVRVLLLLRRCVTL